VVNGGIASGLGVIIGRRWWPLIGTALAAGYTWILYDKALRKAAQSGSVGWNSPGTGSAWKGLTW
jgi:hypothetical protein